MSTGTRLGRFHKMHGLGNDFVIVDARQDDLPMSSAKAAAIANRRNGIGCDQLIILRSSSTADVKMQIFNADGGEVEACGNAARCVAKLLGNSTSIETDGGLISGNATDAGAIVDMGTPSLAWQSIPLAYAMDVLHMPVGWEDLQDPAAVNVGNPHVIFFVDDCNMVELDRLGAMIEVDPLFPGPRECQCRAYRGWGRAFACVGTRRRIDPGLRNWRLCNGSCGNPARIITKPGNRASSWW